MSTRFFVSFLARAEWTPDSGDEAWVDDYQRIDTDEVRIPIQAATAEDALEKFTKKLEDLCK